MRLQQNPLNQAMRNDLQSRMKQKNEFRIEGDVVWISLTRGKETCVDLVDWDRVKEHRWYALRCKNQFYARKSVWVEGKCTWISLHRFLMGENAQDIDHEDGDGLNNRRDNLRPCSHASNQANKRMSRNNTSGFKGVVKSGPKWRARIEIRGTLHSLGSFTDPADAARAYNVAAKKAFGEFARLNPVDFVMGLSGIHSISEKLTTLNRAAIDRLPSL